MTRTVNIANMTFGRYYVNRLRENCYRQIHIFTFTQQILVRTNLSKMYFSSTRSLNDLKCTCIIEVILKANNLRISIIYLNTIWTFYVVIVAVESHRYDTLLFTQLYLTQTILLNSYMDMCNWKFQGKLRFSQTHKTSVNKIQKVSQNRETVSVARYAHLKIPK